MNGERQTNFLTLMLVRTYLATLFRVFFLLISANDAPFYWMCKVLKACYVQLNALACGVCAYTFPTLLIFN